MSQDKLNWLSLLSTESDVLRSIGFDDINNDFAKQKHEKCCYIDCQIWYLRH
jgi:hypothetical protein